MTDGALGELPDWYRTRCAAKSMGVPPWELAKQPIVWQEWELTALAAEASANKGRQPKGVSKKRKGRT